MRELFGDGSNVFPTPQILAERIGNAFPPDFAMRTPIGFSPNFLHRKIGPRDLYMIHGLPEGSECEFRSTGQVELWDPWTGECRPMPVLEQTPDCTRLRLPLSEHDAHLIVFSPGTPLFLEASARDIAKSKIDLAGDWEFELKPTLDNRFGDFRWPPSPAVIGAEARRFRHAEETAPNPGWEKPDYNDSAWSMVSSGFGPKFWKLGPVPDGVILDEQLAGLATVDPALPVTADGMEYPWLPYEFSWSQGVEGDPGEQGWHGLKEKLSDDFIVLGARKRNPNVGHFEHACEPEGRRYYLWTNAWASRDGKAVIRAGGNLPSAVYLNGLRLESLDGALVDLKTGANSILLRYDTIGRGHFVIERPGCDKLETRRGDLRMTWTGHPGLIPFDPRPAENRPIGWFRFIAPPGLRSFTVRCDGAIRAWVEGNEVTEGESHSECLSSGESLNPEALSHESSILKPFPVRSFRLPTPARRKACVALRIELERGDRGGSAISELVALDCGSGFMPLGDWSKMGALECYSGGAWYRKTVALTAEQAGGEVVLDLGAVVASAEVHVNGRLAGVRIAPPWRFTLSGLIKVGENRLEILVYNTLANHYVTIPTFYRGKLKAGLLGLVILETG